jgi:hypothetical protein
MGPRRSRNSLVNRNRSGAAGRTFHYSVRGVGPHGLRCVPGLRGCHSAPWPGNGSLLTIFTGSLFAFGYPHEVFSRLDIELLGGLVANQVVCLPHLPQTHCSGVQALLQRPGYDLFLSYNSADHSIVEEVAHKLADAGIAILAKAARGEVPGSDLQRHFDSVRIADCSTFERTMLHFSLVGKSPLKGS